MKAKIVYVKEGVETIIENEGCSFINFCKALFEKKIYLSGALKGNSLAINTDNILFVEEIR